MEKTNFVRRSTGIGRCRTICRILIQLGADFLGLPEEEEYAEGCWWDDPAAWSYGAARTRDRSHARLEEHWVDEDLRAHVPAWAASGEARIAVHGAHSDKRQFFSEFATVKEKEKPATKDGKTFCRIGIARFLKLGGTISGGDGDHRRLVFSTDRSLHVPLIKTDGSLYVDYP